MWIFSQSNFACGNILDFVKKIKNQKPILVEKWGWKSRFLWLCEIFSQSSFACGKKNILYFFQPSFTLTFPLKSVFDFCVFFTKSKIFLKGFHGEHNFLFFYEIHFCCLAVRFLQICPIWLKKYVLFTKKHNVFIRLWRGFQKVIAILFHF